MNPTSPSQNIAAPPEAVGAGLSDAGVDFQEEVVTPDLFAELKPLLEAHFSEISLNPDIPLNPCVERYCEFSRMGVLKVYTGRQAGNLIAYAAFILNRNLHYQDSFQASEDVIFIRKDKRGFGRHFIAFCDHQLKGLGVQVVYHHFKWFSFNERHGLRTWIDQLFKTGLARMLKGMDYTLADLIWSKRLDK